MTITSAPKWATQHLNAHLDPSDPVQNVALVARNLVLAHTRRGSVVLRRGLFGGITHGVLHYPVTVQSFNAGNVEFSEAAAAEADVSTDWETKADSDEGAAPDDQGADDGIFRHEGYTLHRREGAGGRPLYFFSKGTPKSGSPSPKPEGFLVGLNPKTGLPYLKVDPSYVPDEAPIARDASHHYGGDLHKVSDLSIVPKGLGARLRRLGVEDTDQLCNCDAQGLATALGIERDQVEAWQASAELVKVKGIGPQASDLMAQAGIRGIDDLKGRSAAGIAAAVNLHIDTHKGKHTHVTAHRVEGWQKAARKLRRGKAKPFLLPGAATPVEDPAPATTPSTVASTGTPAAPAQAPVVVLDSHAQQPGQGVTATEAEPAAIRAPAAPAAKADLKGLDPSRGDIEVQWDTAPQLAAERSRRAPREEETPMALGGKGNEVRLEAKTRPVQPGEPGPTDAKPTAEPPHILSVYKHAPPEAPEGVEVRVGNVKHGSSPPVAAKAREPVPEPTPKEEPAKAVDGSVIEVVRGKGGKARPDA